MSALWKEGFPGLVKCFFMLEKMLTMYFPKVLQHLVGWLVDVFDNCSKIWAAP
jgi:hypothetical protein